MLHADVLIDAARTVRPYLGDLVGPRAVEFDTMLAHHLQRHDEGEEIANDIAQLFQSDEVTNEWLAEFLEDPAHLPPDFQAMRSGAYEPIPGRGNVQIPPKWACPVDGNYVVYQRNLSQVIGPCPTHHVDLARVD